MQPEIRSIAVTSDAEAKELMFPGSPTIRIDGTDVELNEKATPGLQCRLYTDLSGLPSEEMLRLAVSRAKEKE